MVIAERNSSVPPWLLLAFSLPRKGASFRVAVWRKLQRYGSLPLGNSGYLLPNSASNREKFEWLATAIRGAQGEASVLEVQSIDNYSSSHLTKRFSAARSRDYRDLLKALRSAASASKKSPAYIARLRLRFQEIVSIDFFGSPLREQVDQTLLAMQERQSTLASPDLGKVLRSEYRNRKWVTRPRPGVDRVLSAWLIRKFIDPKARFVFSSENEKPTGAVPLKSSEQFRPAIHRRLSDHVGAHADRLGRLSVADRFPHNLSNLAHNPRP